MNIKRQKVLITGAGGYVGKRLSAMFVNHPLTVICCVRTVQQFNPPHLESVLVEDITTYNRWKVLLKGCDTIIHLVARAHIINDSLTNSIDEFRKVNRDATLRLAEAAVAASIKRFVYVSSIGVLGNSTSKDGYFDNKTPYSPQEPYAISKMEAEIGLKEISDSTGLEIVNVRPPLVYGPGAPGNFRRLLQLVDTGLPLPLGKMVFRKNMISLNNLCDILIQCVSASLPRFNQFVVSDGSDWSTADLVRLIAEYMGKRQPILPVPVFLLKALAIVIGRSKEIQKLIEPLVVDGSETSRILNWSPVQVPKDGVKEAVDYYLAHKQHR